MIIAERLRELLHYDPETGAFTRLVRTGRMRTGAVAGNIDTQGYLQIMIDRRQYRTHRLAWLYMTGEWPDQIDHISGDKGDNRWNNLRVADNSKNQMNAHVRANNTSGFKGVDWHKAASKWRARIKAGGKRINLGCYDTRHVAYAAVCIAARKFQGEFARLYDDDIMIEPGPRSLANDWLGI